jgi:hypothetical protein
MNKVAVKAQRLSVEPDRAVRAATDQATMGIGQHGYASRIDGGHEGKETGKSLMNSIEISDDDISNQDSTKERMNDSTEKVYVLWEDLPIVLQVPRKPNHNPTLHNIEEAPDELESKIRSLWGTVRQLPSYKNKLDPMVKTYRQYRKALNSTTCLRTRVIAFNSKNQGIFKEGGAFRESADDPCIRKYLPCTYLMEHNGNPTLCVVPLPARLRTGKDWTDIAFWVL